MFIFCPNKTVEGHKITFLLFSPENQEQEYLAGDTKETNEKTFISIPCTAINYVKNIFIKTVRHIRSYYTLCKINVECKLFVMVRDY